jgi:hypothetical protein
VSIYVDRLPERVFSEQYYIHRLEELGVHVDQLITRRRPTYAQLKALAEGCERLLAKYGRFAAQ